MPDVTPSDIERIQKKFSGRFKEPLTPGEREILENHQRSQPATIKGYNPSLGERIMKNDTAQKVVNVAKGFIEPPGVDVSTNDLSVSFYNPFKNRYSTSDAENSNIEADKNRGNKHRELQAVGVAASLPKRGFAQAGKALTNAAAAGTKSLMKNKAIAQVPEELFGNDKVLQTLKQAYNATKGKNPNKLLDVENTKKALELAKAAGMYSDDVVKAERALKSAKLGTSIKDLVSGANKFKGIAGGVAGATGMVNSSLVAEDAQLDPASAAVMEGTPELEDIDVPLQKSKFAKQAPAQAQQANATPVLSDEDMAKEKFKKEFSQRKQLQLPAERKRNWIERASRYLNPHQAQLRDNKEALNSVALQQAMQGYVDPETAFNLQLVENEYKGNKKASQDKLEAENAKMLQQTQNQARLRGDFINADTASAVDPNALTEMMGLPPGSIDVDQLRQIIKERRARSGMSAVPFDINSLLQMSQQQQLNPPATE